MTVKLNNLTSPTCNVVGLLRGLVEPHVTMDVNDSMRMGTQGRHGFACLPKVTTVVLGQKLH